MNPAYLFGLKLASLEKESAGLKLMLEAEKLKGKPGMIGNWAEDVIRRMNAPTPFTPKIQRPIAQQRSLPHFAFTP